MMGHMSDLAEQLPDVPTLLAELDSVSYLADEPLGLPGGRPEARAPQ